MCHLYSLDHKPEHLANRFQYGTPPTDYVPRRQIYPRVQALAVMRNGKTNRAVALRFGLIPSWTTELKRIARGQGFVNVQAESLPVKRYFARLLRHQRCLILADGFYACRTADGYPKQKTQFLFRLTSGAPFAFAGLWDTWQSPEGETVVSCAIVITSANILVSPVHDRMPVILPDGCEQTWLAQENICTTERKTVLRPYPAGEMEACEVGPAQVWKHSA